MPLRNCTWQNNKPAKVFDRAIRIKGGGGEIKGHSFCGRHNCVLEKEKFLIRVLPWGRDLDLYTGREIKIEGGVLYFESHESNLLKIS